MAFPASIQKLLRRVPPVFTSQARVFPSVERMKNVPIVSCIGELDGHAHVSVSSSLAEESTHLNSFHPWAFLPVFPFGMSLNPMLPIGRALDKIDNGDESGMWTDSVKKKRKKKMNKHKYKKLMKRIGKRK